MKTASNSMNATTVATDTKTVARANCSVAPVKKSSFARGMRRRYGSGESSATTADKLELTAQSSETNRTTKVQSLSDRLTPSLISAGLVKGTIPTSIRKASSLGIRGIASWWPDGDGVE